MPRFSLLNLIQQTEQRALLHGTPMSRTLKVYHAAALFIKYQIKMPIWGLYEFWEVITMVKVRVSYDRPEELQKILKILGDAVLKCTTAKEQKGRYNRAYIILRD